MAKTQGSSRKLIAFDAASLQALDALRRDRKVTLQDLIDEAVADLLKKHNRPTTLKEMLKASARAVPANDGGNPRRKKR